jgi:hypothetical protein
MRMTSMIRRAQSRRKRQETNERGMRIPRSVRRIYYFAAARAAATKAEAAAAELAALSSCSWLPWPLSGLPPPLPPNGVTADCIVRQSQRRHRPSNAHTHTHTDSPGTMHQRQPISRKSAPSQQQRPNTKSTIHQYSQNITFREERQSNLCFLAGRLSRHEQRWYALVRYVVALILRAQTTLIRNQMTIKKLNMTKMRAYRIQHHGLIATEFRLSEQTLTHKLRNRKKDHTDERHRWRTKLATTNGSGDALCAASVFATNASANTDIWFACKKQTNCTEQTTRVTASGLLFGRAVLRLGVRRRLPRIDRTTLRRPHRCRTTTNYLQRVDSFTKFDDLDHRQLQQANRMFNGCRQRPNRVESHTGVESSSLINVASVNKQFRTKMTKYCNKHTEFALGFVAFDARFLQK